MVPRSDDLVRYYQAAHLGLLTLDARGTRKRLSGDEANARWTAFAGDMNDWDRLDLCIRDAAVQFPVALAPRVIFALEGLPEDEPFGERWERPAGQLAHELLHSPPSPPATLTELQDRVAALWGLSLAAPKDLPLAGLGVASRVRVAGAGALAVVASRLAEIEGSNLIDQITLISDEPAERQLFGLAALFTKAAGAGRIWGHHQANQPGPPHEIRVGC
jgi:hypothetical protein